mgnify:CR=1 FL=1
MSTMSYISVIERYHEYESAIKEIMTSILTGIAEEPLFQTKETRCEAMQSLGRRYPFVELLYILDEDGVQHGDSVAVTSAHPAAYSGDGKSRRHRPYFQQAPSGCQVMVTEPYLSTANRKLCITAIIKCDCGCGSQDGYLVLDADLMAMVEFLMGDAQRRRFQPLFKWTYSTIVVGLFLVVAALLFSAFYELFLMMSAGELSQEIKLKPFGVIIFLTLALAIFDLGKTTLEEEVLMHKDIFRHSSTRRTITRFVAAILIAVSIESLLLMFKSALGDGEALVSAVWMMLAAVGLLIGLGLYVYLGAKAEALLKHNGRQRGAANPPT